MFLSNTVFSHRALSLMTILLLLGMHVFASTGNNESIDKPSTPILTADSYGTNTTKGPVRATDYSNYDFTKGYHNELDTPINVAFWSCDNTSYSGIIEYLLEFDDIESIDQFNAAASTPDLEDLEEYDLIWTSSNSQYNDRAAMGDIMADFVDEGGAVVLTMFALAAANWYPTGRFLDEDYYPMAPAAYIRGPSTLSDMDEAHPIMEDVETGFAVHWYIQSEVAEDAEEVGTLAADYPFCCCRDQVVAFGANVNDSYTTATDARLAVHNAMIWATGGGAEPDASMEGTIADAVTGDAMDGAVIRVSGGRDTTDVNGDYFMNVVAGEERGLRIVKEHYYNYNEDIDIELGENFFDFEITPLATIYGVISDSETEEIIEGAIISWGDHVDTSDVDGNYTLVDLEAGADTLVIEAEGYFEYEDEEYEVEDGDNEIDFAIDILSGDLTGVVIDELTEEQLFGATITVVDPETGDIYREVTTDETGAYNAPALHDGVTYEVSVTLAGYAPSDVEEVLIRWNRDNEQDFEMTPIFELGIRQLQQEQDVETWVTTTGIVTQGTNVTDTEQTIIYIQDDSGWGIMLWDEDPWDPENNINRGDGVTVIGFLVEEDDMTQITNFEIEVTSIDNALPDPLVETTGDMSGNSQREGTWGQISGQIDRDPPGEGDYSLIVNDGSGQCEVKIFETTGLDLSEMAANDWGTFTGIIGLSRQGLRLIPNAQEDVARIAIDPPSDLMAEHQTVTGDPLQVEVSLTWSHEHLDEWLRFKIYRDGEHIGNTQQNTWSEKIEDPNPGEFGEYSFVYTVTAVYDEGETEESNSVEVIWSTSVKDRPFSGVPTEWALEAVYPNPFNPTLHVVLGVPQVSNVTVEIMDILGRRVAVLHQGDLSAAYHRVGWNATGHTTGLYFLRVTSNTGFNQINKVMFIK
ncbi:MAG: carboxypeptidase regulatory-like domain-containing protein [Candidatus Electryonea clarkiae]|nr:carboxypeptidase regulatory-like domain-containing protein [Candidatus Electryonea clarkiae]MDP8288864.1 carboxypeptidase regulatory-like domain-containing protein [Candidatus Electryonea clarkiae]